MRRPIVLIALLLSLTSIGRAEGPATRPIWPTRVMIVSIDGCRPDVLLRANAPNVRGLMKGGSFSFWANTTDVAITLPSHTSMLTGVTPAKHRVNWNKEADEPPHAHPAVPTLFELAKRRGLTTACVAGKIKFEIFDQPGALDWKFIKEVPDDQVEQMAAAIVREHRPQVLFVHFPDCDRAGHKDGWGTPSQIAAVEHADHLIGELLSTLNDAKVRDETLIILSADHGGAGKSHGPNDPRSRHIPWIANGPGVKANYDLTLDTKLVIHTEDTFATACETLGIPLPENIDGKPVLDIFAHRELLHAAP